MRQVLIERDQSIQELHGEVVVLKADKSFFPELAFNPGKVALLRIPLNLKVLYGGVVNVKFEVSKALATNGVMLLGAYLENGYVTAAFMALEGTAVSIEEGVPLIVGTLIETVKYKQIEKIEGVQVVNPAGSAIQVPEKPKKRGRKKKE